MAGYWLINKTLLGEFVLSKLQWECIYFLQARLVTSVYPQRKQTEQKPMSVLYHHTPSACLFVCVCEREVEVVREGPLCFHLLSCPYSDLDASHCVNMLKWEWG